MDVVTLNMDLAVLERLIKGGYISSKDFDIKVIEPIDYDYSFDSKWLEARKASIKAFKKQKEIEFKLRK